MNSILPIPSGTIKYAYRVHRLVVLPDYQNLNLGTKINEAIAEMYIEEGNKLFIRTSHIRLYNSLKKNWFLILCPNLYDHVENHLRPAYSNSIFACHKHHRYLSLSVDVNPA